MTKKQKITKLKKTKLEDRIAPGMVGGGLVDPGMADTMDTGDTAAQGDSSAGSSQSMSLDETSADSNTDSTEQHEGNYINESGEIAYDASAEVDADAETDDSAEYSDVSYEGGAGSYVEDTPTWQEPDWVSMSADGGATITPPEGVSIDSGVASFPVDVANDSLPLPENVAIQSDGSVNVALPEGTSLDAASNTLTLPPETLAITEVPEQFNAYEGPDGSVCVPLPEQGYSFDAETSTLNIDNAAVNDIAPSYLEIQGDGTVCVELPEGCEVQANGDLELSPEAVAQFDNPAPEALSNLEWSEYNPDGSMTFNVPDGVEVEGGIATFPYDSIEQLDLPEDVQIQSDGSLSWQAPEGTFAEDGNVTFPQGSVALEQIPAGVDAYLTPDGAVCVSLPDGVDFDQTSGQINFDNYWANEIAPDNVQINSDGSLSVALPEQTEFVADGSQFTVPAEQLDFVETPSPDYVADADFAVAQGDGSYHVMPPEGVTVTNDATGGTMEFSHEQAQEHCPTHEEFTLLEDGSANIELPQGTAYDGELNTLTFPAGAVHLDEIPPQIGAHINPDGSLSVSLPDGIEYNSADNSVHLSNYWVNEITPEPVNITPEGAVQVQLPTDTAYHQDGSFTVSSPSADFLQSPDPSWSQSADFVQSNPDGSYTFESPQSWQVDPQAGTVSIPIEQLSTQFPEQMPEDFVVHSDGSSTHFLPEGSNFDAQAGVLTLPPGEINLNEIPEGISAQLNADGSIGITLPDGISYDAAQNAVNMDAYWTDAVTPDNVEFQDGQCQVTLPSDTHYHGDGNFTISSPSVDFMESPEPSYVAQGPDYMHSNYNGSYTVYPPEGMNVDPQAGVVSFSTEHMHEHYENSIEPGTEFHADGTSTHELPPGTQYDAEANAVTFPPGFLHMEEIPQGISAQLNTDGTLTVDLPPGMEYDAQANTINMDNYWTNAVTPDHVEISPDGQCHVSMPQGTQYHPGGEFTVPQESADFINNPEPSVVHEGPEWASGNSDGSVSLTPPTEFVSFDAEAGTMSMSVDYFAAQFDIPEEITLNADGTADVRLPEGTSYDAASGALTFPAGEVHEHDLPPGLLSEYNPDGSMTVRPDAGFTGDFQVSADGTSVHISNSMLNQWAPEPFEFGTDGQMSVQLPSDTQYFSGGVVISADSANFLDGDDGQHEGGQQPVNNAA